MTESIERYKSKTLLSYLVIFTIILMCVPEFHMHDEYSGNLISISYDNFDYFISILVNGEVNPYASSNIIRYFFSEFSLRFTIGFPLLFITFCGIVIFFLSEFKFYYKKWFCISSIIIMPLLIFLGVDSLYYDNIKISDILRFVLPIFLILCGFYILFYKINSFRVRSNAELILLCTYIILLLLMIPELLITFNITAIIYVASLVFAGVNIYHNRKLHKAERNIM